ncbi:13055_t:CDS:1, partial [Funneliformis geosporum]
MGKAQRQRHFNHRQASLRSRHEEDHRQIIDDLEIEVHQLRQQLDTLNARLNDLSSSNN